VQFNVKENERGSEEAMQQYPYNKDKQQAFQAAQQGYEEASGLFNVIINDSDSYGHQLKHLKNEVNEAYQQIENALEVASEHQRAQLERFQQDLNTIVSEVNLND
jgi:flagellar biosynthesis chaperone FliJ